MQLICWSQLVGFDGRKRGKSDKDIGACPIDGLETKPDMSCKALPLKTQMTNMWVNYNDVTATSLESWLIKEIIPKWPLGALVQVSEL